MKNLLKIYLVVLAILSGIAAFISLLYWGAAQLFGMNGPIIATIILALMFLSFFITALINMNDFNR